MNRRPPGLKLSKAISGFVQHKTAAGLASTTIQGYERDLKKWVTHIGDVDIDDVTTQDVRNYLAWLRTEYKPHRWKKSDDPLSPKTLRNTWVTLSAFFRWASIELDVPNPMKAVPAPHFEEAPVEPFTQQDIEALLKACEFCTEAKTTERRRFTMRRATAKRDRAIILTLLDTGLRASELCALKIGDVTAKLMLAHVGSAMGIVAAETIAGVEMVELEYEFMPRCTYCHPQVASMGLTEKQAREQGYDVKVGKFPFQANGKAQGLGDYAGFVKVVADGKYGEILGVHMVGPEVTELLPEWVLARNQELTPHEVARAVHAHPTLSEVMMEAAEAAAGQAIHI